jgi:hypothetical protein
MVKRVVLGLIIVLSWYSWSAAGDAERPIHVFVDALFHHAAVDGTVQKPDVDVLGTEIDLDGTLGLEDVNGLVGKAGIVIYGRHEIVADYRRYHLAEDTTLASSMHFGDMDLFANLPISPSLKFQTVGLFYGFRVIETDRGFLSIRPGVEFVKYDLGIKAGLLGFEWTSETYAADYTVPFLLIAGESKLHPLISIAGEFSGGMLDKQKAYLAQLLLKITSHPHFSALAGYSRVWFKDKTKDNRFEITFSGFLVGCQFVW